MEQRWKVLILYSIGSFMAFLDAPVVTVAFPAFQQDFATTPPATLAWVLDAYFIAFAALLVIAGVLADRFGRRRVFLIGLWAFGVASLVCAVAASSGTLIAARAVQGMGAALVVPSGLGLMLAAFAPDKRKEAIGINAAIIGLAIAASPAIGGVIVDGLSWRWLFLLNLPVILATVLWTHSVVERDETARAGTRLPDFVGAAVQAAGVSLVVLAILKRQEWGTIDPRTIATFAAGITGTILVFFRAPRGRSPVIDRTLFRDRTFTTANLSVFVFSVGFFSTTISSVLFMTSVWGYSILQAGLAFAPGAVVVALLGGPAGKIAERHGTWAVSMIGSFLAAAGLGVIVLSTSGQPNFLGTWLPGQVIYSAGVVAAMTGLVSAAVTAAPSEKFAVASGLNTAIRQVGGAVGVAIAVATVSVSATQGDALGRSHTAFTIALGAMAAGGVIAWFMRVTRPAAHEAAVSASPSTSMTPPAR